MTLSLKLLGLILGLLATLYLVACLYLYFRQTRMLFFPTAQITTTPADFGLPFEEVWIPVGDRGDRIHGWWIPASGPETGVLLYLHGNGINIGANVEQANRFHQLGLSVLLIDYRGHGRSQGSFPHEQQVYQDAEASWQYLIQDRNVAPQHLFIFGHSMGGAIAINLASQHPDAAGLIVQSSFTSIRDMVDRNPIYRIFPIDLLLTQRLESIRKVPRLQMPTLFIHGLADAEVPAQMSQMLYAAAPQPKQIYLVPIAGHNNVAATAGEAYLQIVQQFIQQSLRPKAQIGN